MSKRQAVGRAALVAVACLASVLPARLGEATVAVQKPWHPIAAAYRTATFMVDLKPPAWARIGEAYTGVVPGTATPATAAEQLGRLGLAGGTAEVEAAVAARDHAALYAAATRLTSRAVRASLDAAKAGQGSPGKAFRDVLEAQAIYRAFAEFVAQADPEGARRLGGAWLTLTTSAGSAGVAGAGAVPVDRGRFDAAARTISEYLRANYEPERFVVRERATPLPETVVLEKGEIGVVTWLPPGSDLTDQDPLPRLVLNFEKQGIEESSLPLVAYGDMLFDSPEILGKAARDLGIACSTCHNRSDINRRFFIPGVSHQAGAADVDGRFLDAAIDDRRNDSIDIPTLRGIRFTGPYGRDGRMASLREFSRNVIVGEFGGPEPTPYMLDSLIAYMTEFDFLPNAKLGRGGRLTDTASAAARRGEVLFNTPFPTMNGQACSSCHMPTANFLDKRQHDIGSGTPGYEGSRENAYDTPTLLGARFTAPYFHDGSVPTLAGVVDWFDSRYGLGLAENQRADLTAYVEAVGDADEPYQAFDGRETPFRLAFEELTTFASTLDSLIPARDRFHADLMIRTVAADLEADASGMANRGALEQVYALADQLRAVQAAILADDWDRAAAGWAEFKRRQETYDAAMF